MNLTRHELYTELVSAHKANDLRICVPYPAATASSLRENHFISKRGLFEFGNAKEKPRIENALITNFSVHEAIFSDLRISIQSNGYPYYWDIDGKPLQVPVRSSLSGGPPFHIEYWIIDNIEYWFKLLCDLDHSPAIPPHWLVEPLTELQSDEVCSQFSVELKPGDQLWSYAISSNEIGPCYYRSGYAVVRDNVPVIEIQTLIG